MDKGGEPESLNDDKREDIPSIYWREKQRVLSRGSLKTRPEMLETEGYTILEVTNVVGRGKRTQDAIPCTILYDEEYVVEKLAREFGEVILGVDRSVFLKVYSKAKTRAKDLRSESLD